MDSRLITLGKAADAVRRFNVRLLNFLPPKPLTNKREIERLKDRLLQFFKKYGEAAAKAINTFFDAVELFKREDYAPQCKEVYYLSYSTRKVMKRLKAQFTDTDLFTTYEDNEVTFFKALLPPANKVVAQREWKTQLRLLPNKRKSVEVLARNVIAYLQGGTADYEVALERFFSTHTVKAVVAGNDGIRDWGLGNGKVKVEGEGERWTDNAFDYGAGNGVSGKLVKYGGDGPNKVAKTMTDILQTIKRKLSQGCKDFTVERWMLTPKDQPLIDHGVFTFNGKFSDRFPCPNCEAPFQFTLKDGMYYGVCTSCATLGEDAWPPSQVELMDFSYRKFILFINNPTITGEYAEEAAKCLTDDLAKAGGSEDDGLAICETPHELLRYLAGKDARSDVAHLVRIGQLFKENWIFIVTNDEKSDGKPDGWLYFETLEQTLNDEIAKIAKGQVKAPCSCGEWQRILPEALTFPYDEAIYYEAAEDDDDPAVAEYTILGDRKARVGWKYRPQPLAPYIDKVRDLLPAYLTEALKYAQSINSRSSEQWAVALGCFNRVKHAFTMPQSRPLLDQMAQAMIDAATRLEIDIKFASTEVAPVPAYITGVSKEGGKALRAEMKDKGGPTAKPVGAFLKHSQKDVALMFGPPCNLDMVANWEAYEKTNGKRGAMPPSAILDGKAYPYSVGLRVNPSPKNKIILAALIEEFKKTAGVKDGISKFVHPRSEESLSRAPKA